MVDKESIPDFGQNKCRSVRVTFSPSHNLWSNSTTVDATLVIELDLPSTGSLNIPLALTDRTFDGISPPQDFETEDSVPSTKEPWAADDGDASSNSGDEGVPGAEEGTIADNGDAPAFGGGDYTDEDKMYSNDGDGEDEISQANQTSNDVDGFTIDTASFAQGNCRAFSLLDMVISTGCLITILFHLL
jgi:hypothetical protein